MGELRRVVLEGVLIAVVGIGIALAANAGNPAGLQLSKDYFGRLRVNSRPNANGSLVTSTVPNGATPVATSRPTPSEENDSGKEQIKAMVIANGLNPIEHEEAAKLFRDPYYERGLYVFLDARNDDDYAAGHIPGAYHLYAFLSDEAIKQQFFDEFIPIAGGAEKVVVYCSGGHCDDSVQVALDLPQRGLDPAKVVVDVDGMSAWKKAGMPIERGVRNSGDIVGGKK